MATKKKAKKKRYWVNVYNSDPTCFYPAVLWIGKIHKSKREAIKNAPVKIVKTISFTI